MNDFLQIDTSLQHPAVWPLRALQKGGYVFIFDADSGIRNVPHKVIYTNFPRYHTPVNGHRFVGWRGEIMKGKGLLKLYDRIRTSEGWNCLRRAVWEA